MACEWVCIRGRGGGGWNGGVRGCIFEGRVVGVTRNVLEGRC